MGFQGKVKVSTSLPLWLRCRRSLILTSDFCCNWCGWSENNRTLKMSAENCSRVIVVINTKSCRRVQELHACWSTFPVHAAISAASFSCQIPTWHGLEDTSQQAILHHYMLRMMLTSYFLFLSRETETVIVERCYTAIGTSRKNSAKFMPFAGRNLARTPRVR